MQGWRTPTRGEVLPVSENQSCGVCGAPDWSWLYLLLNAPEWVQQRGWFANWFLAMCDGCHAAWERDDQDALRARWALDDAHSARSLPGSDEYRKVVAAMQSEPPLTRAEATSQ